MPKNNIKKPNNAKTIYKHSQKDAKHYTRSATKMQNNYRNCKVPKIRGRSCPSPLTT